MKRQRTGFFGLTNNAATIVLRPQLACIKYCSSDCIKLGYLRRRTKLGLAFRNFEGYVEMGSKDFTETNKERLSVKHAILFVCPYASFVTHSLSHSHLRFPTQVPV